MGPLPSIGSPSALTTRPRRASPTGTVWIRPVALTVCSSSRLSTSPRTTAPIVSSSRFSARPNVPSSNSSSSLTAAPGRPDTRAIPSPTSTIRPICSVWTSEVYSTTWRSSAAVISLASIVSSVITLLPLRLPMGRTLPASDSLSSQPPGTRCSRRASRRPRAVASTWRSPIWITAPLRSAGSMTTCDSTGDPAKSASDAERSDCCASSTGAAARTRAIRHPRAAAVCSTSQFSVPTKSRADRRRWRSGPGPGCRAAPCPQGAG